MNEDKAMKEAHAVGRIGLCLGLILGLGLGLPGCATQDKAAQAGGDPKGNELTNGGKVRPPFEVQSSLEGEVTTDASVPVTVTVTPQAACRRLWTALRGLDGVEVEGTPKEHPCAAGQAVLHNAQVRVYPGAAGRLVADVRIELEDGRSQASSRSFEVHRPGAGRAEKPNGTVTYDANGNPIILMPSGAN